MLTLTNAILTYKYFILLPAVMIEGPISMMLSGFFVKLGYLNFLLAYLLLMSGDLLGDVVWYGIGYKFGIPFLDKFGKFFSITKEGVAKVEDIFLKHDSKILLFSKVTMGFGFALATLFTAGLVKTSFKRFVFWNALGGLVWTGVLMIIGFSFGNFYLKVDNVLAKIGTLALFVIVFIILTGVGKYMKAKLQ